MKSSRLEAFSDGVIAILITIMVLECKTPEGHDRAGRSACWRRSSARIFRRVGRPPLGDRARQLIAIRVDPGILDEFRKEARRRRVGYQTLINEVLAQHVGKDVA